MAAKSFRQHVVDLYNAGNASLPHPLTLEDITFGSRAAVADEDAYNFALSIAAVDESEHFTGSHTLHYKRLPFPELTTLEAKEEDADYDNNDVVIAALNTALAAVRPDEMFTAVDFDMDGCTIERTGNDENRDFIVEVLMNGNGLKYSNNGVIFTINVAGKSASGKTDLSTTNGELDGFSQ